MNNEQSNNKVHNNLALLQRLAVSGGSLNAKHWYDGLSASIADFLTSVLLIMLVMIAFLCGIAIHIKAVFDSWFLAVGFQSVVLLTSVNSDLLPKYKQLPIIAICMSVLTCIFVFLSFDGHLSTGVMLLVNIIKSIAVAGVEFIFAYLFCARNNRTKAEKAGYVFDLEGRVVATPFDEHLHESEHQHQQQATQQTNQQAVQHVDEVQTTELKPAKTSNFPATDATTFNKTCACGLTFNNKADWDAHIKQCDIHKWFEQQ